jgi:assimilatory nitrate reductase catalytic subunit
VLAALARRLGVDHGFPTDPREVFAELRVASAGGIADYAGITWERIEATGGVFWPCPGEDHPGTPRMFTESFPTPDGRGRFHPVEPTIAAEEPDAEYPLWLITGRVGGHYQSGAQTRRIPELACSSFPSVEVHPAVAGALGLADGATARLTSRRGSALLTVRVVDTIRSDTVFAPFHWGGAARVNSLTDPTLDPVSRMPAFKACAARLDSAGPEGAGLEGAGLDWPGDGGAECGRPGR